MDPQAEAQAYRHGVAQRTLAEVARDLRKHIQPGVHWRDCLLSLVEEALRIGAMSDAEIAAHRGQTVVALDAYRAQLESVAPLPPAA